ncbi:hypothetical protein RUM43_007141 [Polyplax serrata]|uniref:Spondin domain-containing protein n=1 Tax=Polyplax serrata TaxID=468196 RepID=A0AAN8PM90_POLSC
MNEKTQTKRFRLFVIKEMKIGRSHDSSFELFRPGKKASKGLKAFAETGRTDILEEQSQGDDGIYDEFTASAIPTGAGRTETEFFVDGNHSRVSIMSRIVPSPDWFIGIDGFDLCVDGNWVDSITIEADPMDAGTDNGFTFTAPNWPTEPQGVIYKVTSKYPSHPAGSFYYPYMKKLPAIGTFQFIKVKEYELSEVFQHTEDKDHFEVMKIDSVSENGIPDKVNNNDLEEEIEEEEKEEEMRKFKIQSYKPYNYKVTTTATSTSTEVAPSMSTPWGSNDSLATSTPFGTYLSPDAVNRGDKNAILKKIVQIYKSDHHKHKLRKLKKHRPPRDCQVSDWADWGACSKSCGIGEMERRREVIKHARRGGRVCPPLVETKWCGSARSCPKRYFKW